MKLIKEFMDKYIYVFSIMVVFIGTMLLFLCNILLFKDGRFDYDIKRVLAYLIPLLFVLGIYYGIGYRYKVKFKKNNFVLGFFLGWPFIVVGLYNFIPSLTKVDKSILFDKIIYYILIMIFIGLFEEVLCRGIVLNNMINKWGNTKAGIIKSVIISSFIFGVGHLVNLLVTPSLVIITLSQVLTATLHGTLYASVYIRTKSLWTVIILHSVWDFLVMFSGIFNSESRGVTPTDITFVSLTINVLYALPFALVAIFLLRKVAINESIPV